MKHGLTLSGCPLNLSATGVSCQQYYLPSYIAVKVILLPRTIVDSVLCLLASLIPPQWPILAAVGGFGGKMHAVVDRAGDPGYFHVMVM